MSDALSRRHFLLALFVLFLWSLNLVAVRVAVLEMSPFVVTCLRFLATALFLLPFVKRPTGHYHHLFFLAIMLGIGHFGIFFTGMQYVGAGMTSLLLQTQVPMGILAAFFILGERPKKVQILGLCIAFVGLFFLLDDPENRAAPLGVLLISIGAFSWGLANVYIRKHLSDLNNFTVLAWMSVFATPMLGLIALVRGDSFYVLFAASQEALLSLLFIVFGSTFVAYGLWFYLVQRNSVSRLIPVTLTGPFFAALLGWIFLGEVLYWERVIGACILLSGVFCSSLGRKRKSIKIPVAE